jgi:hypothetical protein
MPPARDMLFAALRLAPFGQVGEIRCLCFDCIEPGLSLSGRFFGGRGLALAGRTTGCWLRPLSIHASLELFCFPLSICEVSVRFLLRGLSP